MHRSTNNSQTEQAFTLLEMILSVALTGVLAVAAFTLTNGAVQMGAELGKDQKRALEVQRCIEVFRMQMESLSGSTRFELLTGNTSLESEAELRLYNAPMAFQVGATLRRSDIVNIVSEELEGGEVGLGLRFDTLGESNEVEQSRYLPLMDGLSEVIWRCYSQVDEDWLTEWEQAQGRPRLIELNLAFADGHRAIRTVFWLPPAVDPKTVVLQNNAQNRGNQPLSEEQGDFAGDREGEGEGAQPLSPPQPSSGTQSPLPLTSPVNQ